MQELVIKKRVCIKEIVIFVLMCIFWALLVLDQNALYMTIRDWYYNLACICLIVIVMLVRKDFHIVPISILPFAAVVLGSINFLYDTRDDWGIEYKRVLFSRHCLYAVIIMYTLSIILGRQISELRWKKTITGVLCAAFVFAAAVMDYEQAFYVVFPFFIILSIGKIEKEKLMHLANIAAATMYLSFFLMMTTSLIMSPGKEESGRYIGLYTFPIVTGVLSALGVVGAAHFCFLAFDKKRLSIQSKSWCLLIRTITLALLVYPLIMLLISTNRASLLGVLIIVLSLFIYAILNLPKKPRVVVFIILLCIFVAGCFGFIWMSKNFVFRDFAEAHNITSDSTIYYLLGHLPSSNDRTYTYVFEPGTIGNALDRMSSDRIGIWICGLRQATLFGKNSTEVLLPDGCIVAHVHSSYIHWIMRYGWIVGILGIAWMASAIIHSVILFYRDGQRWLLAPIWILFASGVLFVEKECWGELVPMITLLMQYWAFYDIDSVSEKQNCLSEKDSL